MAMATAARGAGSPELRSVDFPSVGGLRPIHGTSGGVAAARHRHVMLTGSGIEFQFGLICNFSLLLDLSVRTVL